ncbi:hypothetical protein FHR29_004653 [Sphingobacterium sp. JUb56]|nr:hypothetical protein [Sphingobacterium sp. JUb56]
MLCRMKIPQNICNIFVVMHIIFGTLSDIVAEAYVIIFYNDQIEKE